MGVSYESSWKKSRVSTIKSNYWMPLIVEMDWFQRLDCDRDIWSKFSRDIVQFQKRQNYIHRKYNKSYNGPMKRVSNEKSPTSK